MLWPNKNRVKTGRYIQNFHLFFLILRTNAWRMTPFFLDFALFVEKYLPFSRNWVRAWRHMIISEAYQASDFKHDDIRPRFLQLSFLPCWIWRRHCCDRHCRSTRAAAKESTPVCNHLLLQIKISQLSEHWHPGCIFGKWHHLTSVNIVSGNAAQPISPVRSLKAAHYWSVDAITICSPFHKRFFHRT